MKRCPNGKRRVGRICKRKPRAKARATKKRKKSKLTKFFIRGSRAKGTKRKYLTQRQLDAIRLKRFRQAQARRDAKREAKRRQPRAPRQRRDPDAAARAWQEMVYGPGGRQPGQRSIFDPETGWYTKS